ncbi:hypothetical protein JX265_009872 [Neoarthrinium moseri]|uniref:Uncharacterized protein n=1 Tax=Neoarthrinium moseri TaxID=1658444 RepID=A0A9P9WFG2_9PEZI|nr:hypothetical protein JX265_009872 [Neoarthrinium moseri]
MGMPREDEVQGTLDSILAPQVPHACPPIHDMSWYIPQPNAGLVAEPLRSTIGLLTHWEERSAHLMMPVLAPSHNPWLRLYIPTALQQPPSRAKESLLNAVVSAAAYHKAECSPHERAHYLQRAAHCKRAAAESLRSAVDSIAYFDSPPINTTDRKALLAAAISMSSIEVFSGENEGNGYQNLLLGRKIIRLTGGTDCWLTDTEGETLLQIFRCNQVIATSSGWAASQGNEDEDGDMQDVAQLPNPPISFPSQYTLDTTFGISIRTMRCLSQIAEFSRVIDRDSGRGTWLRDNAEAINYLEADIFDVFNDPDAFRPQTPGDGAGVSDFVNDEIKENHLWAFHYSTAIFFRRVLCNGGSVPSSSRKPTDSTGEKTSLHLSGQYLVDKALEHLENIDALSSDAQNADTLWVGFIAAVEAVDMGLRHRAIAWFGRAKRHRISNIAKAKTFVQEVWRRVDRCSWNSSRGLNSELGPIDWRDVMREKGMYIMLT